MKQSDSFADYYRKQALRTDASFLILIESCIRVAALTDINTAKTKEYIYGFLYNFKEAIMQDATKRKEMLDECEMLVKGLYELSLIISLYECHYSIITYVLDNNSAVEHVNGMNESEIISKNVFGDLMQVVERHIEDEEGEMSKILSFFQPKISREKYIQIIKDSMYFDIGNPEMITEYAKNSAFPWLNPLYGKKFSEYADVLMGYWNKILAKETISFDEDGNIRHSFNIWESCLVSLLECLNSIQILISNFSQTGDILDNMIYSDVYTAALRLLEKAPGMDEADFRIDADALTDSIENYLDPMIEAFSSINSRDLIKKLKRSQDTETMVSDLVSMDIIYYRMLYFYDSFYDLHAELYLKDTKISDKISRPNPIIEEFLDFLREQLSLLGSPLRYVPMQIILSTTMLPYSYEDLLNLMETIFNSVSDTQREISVNRLISYITDIRENGYLYIEFNLLDYLFDDICSNRLALEELKNDDDSDRGENSAHAHSHHHH